MASDEQPRIRPGEQPISVFISSVMRPELNDARSTVVKALDASSLFLPWAFEYTPASSEQVDQGYLRKVREADFLVWLVERDITAPVQSELLEALSSGVHILVFRLPCGEREPLVSEYLEKVRPHSKYGDASDLLSLGHEVRLTFQDEIIRAIREKPRLAFTATLEGIVQASLARCVVRWKACGLETSLAEAMARNSSIGTSEAVAAIIEGRSFAVIVGELGIGKSLLAERLLYRAAEALVSDPLCPLPLYLKVRDCKNPLETYVREQLASLGDPLVRGLFLVIDGLDECPPAQSSEVLNQSWVLTRQWRNARVVLTSRRIPILEPFKDDLVAAPLLSESDALDLISMVVGSDSPRTGGHWWPEELRDAIRRPLFALLMGNYLKTRKDLMPTSPVQLLSHLVERALKPEMGNVIEHKAILCRLARLSIDRNGTAIPIEELGPIEAQEALERTSLVVINDGLAEFALPILLQWFAGQSLVSGVPEARELADDPFRLEIWKQPLKIIVGTGDFETASAYLSAISQRNPGLAAQVVSGGLAHWGLDETLQAPSATECWEKLRRTMQCWADGLGPLAEVVAPVDRAGKVLPLGLRTNGAWIAGGWYYGQADSRTMLDLPTLDNAGPGFPPGWHSIRSARPGRQPCWPWLWTLDDLRAQMRHLIKNRKLTSSHPLLMREFLWKVALALDRKGDLFHGPISLARILKRLSETRDGVTLTISGKVTFLVGPARREFELLRDNGAEWVQPPWPGPDLDQSGPYLEDCCSSQRLIERTRGIYLAALRTYEELCNGLFKQVSSRMNLAATLPARFHGLVAPPSTGERWTGLVGWTWYFEPLEKGPSEVDIQVYDGPPIDHQQVIQKMDSLFQRLRGSAWPWIRIHYCDAFISTFKCTPVSDLVYKWLEEDLRGTAWVT